MLICRGTRYIVSKIEYFLKEAQCISKNKLWRFYPSKFNIAAGYLLASSIACHIKSLYEARRYFFAIPIYFFITIFLMFIFDNVLVGKIFTYSKSHRHPHQILQPCHWSFTVEQSATGEAILVSTAKLDSGWHLYSQHIPDTDPRTEFAYDSLDTYNFCEILKKVYQAKCITLI